MHQLEISKVVLVHFNTHNNVYQQDSIALYKFVPNKSIAQLLEVSPRKLYF